MNKQQEITMTELISLWMSKIGEQYRRYKNKHAISRNARDTEISRRIIADEQALLRHLNHERMNLLAERNSIQ